MISLLHGTVASISGLEVVIETSSGLGYTVFPTANAFLDIKEGAQVRMVVHLIVREDSLTLYGFANNDEKKLFLLLLGVSGVGPKVALGFLASPVAELQQYIESGDFKALTKFPGVGKKTAQKIILELQGKLVGHEPEHQLKSQNSAKNEATEALLGLGYDSQSIKKALEVTKATSAEDIIREFLQFYA